MTTSATFHVVGMTCEHCVRAVRDEIGQLPSVREVSVELADSGPSAVQVISDTPLAHADVERAVDEAGYQLAEAAP